MPKTVDAVIFPSQFPLCLALEAETLRHVRQQLVSVAGSSLMGQTCGAKNQAAKTDEHNSVFDASYPLSRSCQIMSNHVRIDHAISRNRCQTTQNFSKNGQIFRVSWSESDRFAQRNSPTQRRVGHRDFAKCPSARSWKPRPRGCGSCGKSWNSNGECAK